MLVEERGQTFVAATYAANDVVAHSFAVQLLVDGLTENVPTRLDLLDAYQEIWSAGEVFLKPLVDYVARQSDDVETRGRRSDVDRLRLRQRSHDSVVPWCTLFGQ